MVEPIDENWVSVDNLNVEEITATIYKDEEYETMLRNFEEKKGGSKNLRLTHISPA